MGALKTSLVCVVCLFGSVLCHAAEFRLINNQFQRVYTNNLTFTGTNGVSVTNQQGCAESIYHTFHFVYNPSGTNQVVIATDRTLDGADWYIVGTNTFTAATIYETNYTGKWVAYRFRAVFANTNQTTLQFYYDAQ